MPQLRSHRAAWRLLAAFVVMSALAGCARRERDTTPHVLLILVDTLRADHTSLGAYERDTTPRLRDLARDGKLFARHLANAPWTKPSVASILTGLLPPAHGAQWGDLNRVRDREVDILADGFETLPEILRERGFATVALMTNPTLTPEMGYAQGYDRYELLEGTLDGDAEALRLAAEVLDRAERPTFVWCHLMAPHNYVLPEGRTTSFSTPGRTPIRRKDPNGRVMRQRFRMRTRGQAIDTYDEVIRWVDEQVSELVSSVRERHPGTLIVLTSDHGEEFGEHGGYLHARTLHSEILHVPLVLWGPRIPPGTVDTRLSQSIDLLPTVLDALGLDPVDVQGTSLLSDAPDEPPAVYAEKRNGSNAMRALISPDGKLLEHKAASVPGEKPSITGEGHWHYYRDPVGPDREDALADLGVLELARRRALLETIWARSMRLFEERVGEGGGRREIRDEEIEALRQLGYVE